MNKSEMLYGWKPYIYTKSDTVIDVYFVGLKNEPLFKTKEECDAYIESIPNHTEDSYSSFTIVDVNSFTNYISRNLFYTANTHRLLELYTSRLELFLAVKNLFPDIPNDFLRCKLSSIHSSLEEYIDDCISYFRTY